MNPRTRNVGQFPAVLQGDVRDGRLRPAVLAAELGLDPSWVSRLISGDLPLPASLVGALVRHTGNRAYLFLAPDLFKCVKRWLCAPQRESYKYLITMAKIASRLPRWRRKHRRTEMIAPIDGGLTREQAVRLEVLNMYQSEMPGWLVTGSKSVTNGIDALLQPLVTWILEGTSGLRQEERRSQFCISHIGPVSRVASGRGTA